MLKGHGAMEQSNAEVKSPSPQDASPKDGAFDTPTVLTLSAAHMAHDIYTGFLSPLLPLLISRLSIPLAAAGILPSVFRAGSLAQPFMGAWADRADARYFVIVAPTITALCMSLVGIAPSYLAAVVLLAVAGLSHSAFHPAAAATVTRASGSTWGKGTSLHMTGGQLGGAIGPLFIVSVVTWLGPEMSYVAAIPGAFFSVMLYLRLRKVGTARVRSSSAAGIWSAIKSQRRALLLLSGFVLFRSTANVSFSTFYPTYLMGRGSSLMYAGLAMTLYQGVGAVGALAGGTLSDRFGRRATLAVTQLLSGPLLYLTLSSPEGPWALILLALGGVVISSASPIGLTLFQELIPGGRSTAAGLWSLLSFEGSLATTLIVGVLGDWIGLGPALGASVLTSMLSIPFILAIQEPRRGG